MQTTVDVTIEHATSASVFEQVDTLDRYPAWMRLVHRVERLEPDAGRPAWWVELRARVGPFARSKRLRMVRTVHEPGHRVRFERVQPDDRDHANWVLTATVDDVADGARVRMDLEYSGSLWGGATLGRILEEEIRRGHDALRALVVADGDRTG